MKNIRSRVMLIWFLYLLMWVSGNAYAADGRLKLSYDDRYDFNKDYKGYSIAEIVSSEAASYQVKKGQASATLDEAVLQVTGDGSIRAVGCGTALVRLVSKENSAAEKLVEVEVSPARLTLMFLLGQSNMEGCTGSEAKIVALGKQVYSLACKPGTVYSTFVPRNSEKAEQIIGYGGLATYNYGKTDPAKFVAASLTSEYNQLGKKLGYPLNALTSEGLGKTGPDSGLAYEWNKKTGDKVWLINMAYGGTIIDMWLPEDEKNGKYLKENFFERCTLITDACVKLAEAEVKAGHYVFADRFAYWMQGESDAKTMAADPYKKKLKIIWQRFKERYQLEWLGLIPCRAYAASEAGDFALTGPRAAQFALGNDPQEKDIFLVARSEEIWTSDKAVTRYFQEKYPTGAFDYPIRKKIRLPRTIAEVHPNVHYSQIGHNENGIEAADTTYAIVKHSSRTKSIVVRNYAGKSISSMTGCAGGKDYLTVIANPASSGKYLQITDPSGLVSYDVKTQKLSYLKEGKGQLQIRSKSGVLLKSIEITVIQAKAPELKSLSYVTGGLKLSFGAVSGASSYRIYRKSGTSGYKSIAEVAGTTFTDKTLPADKTATYTYTVRALDRFGSLVSGYEAKGISRRYFSTPSMKSASWGGSGVTIKWSAVANAPEYAIFRKTSNGSYSWIGKTKGTSFVDKTAVKGKTYYYTVRIINNAGQYLSGYKKTGIKAR